MQSEPPEPVELSLEGIDITSTSSGDLLVQSGEEIRLDAFLTNRSTSAIDSVVFDVERGNSERASHRTFVDGQQVSSFDHATLRPGQSILYKVIMRIPPNTPAGTVEDLSFVVSGTGGRSGSVSGEVEIVALPYRPEILSTRVDMDTDGDGRAEPGETVRISVELSAGAVNTTDLCFDGFGVTTTLAQATVLSGGGAWCVSAAAPATRSSFRFRSASFLPPGTVVPFTLTVQDGYTNTWDLPVRVTLE